MSEPLVLSFKSDTSDARNAIANLASSVVANMMTIGSAMKAANDNVGTLQSGIAALPTILRTAAASFIAFEAVKFSLHAIAEAAEAAQEKLGEIVKIGEEARTAGVGTNFLQQWAEQAKILNTEGEKLVAMLNRAREASTVHLGTGGDASSSRMQDLLGQHVAAGNIGQGDLDAFNAGQSQEERIRTILGLVDRLMSEGRQLAALNLGQAMFGTDFENKLRNGVNIVQQMRDAMVQTKDVAFPPDVIARAEEINKQLDAADRKMREGWLPIQQDILRWQQDELASFATMKDLVGDIAVAFGGWYTAIKSAGTALSDFVNNLSPVKALAEWTKSLPEGIFGRLPGTQFLTDADRQRMIDQRDNPAKLPDITVTRGDRSNRLPSTKTAAGSSTDEVETYINQLQKAVEVLKAENDTFGKSNTLKAEAVDLEKALAAARTRGTPLTDKERETVKRLADEEGRAKDKAEELRKAVEGANARATFLGDQAISAIERIGQSGVRAKDVILDFAKALEKAALQAALLGTGPLAQLFGTGGSGGNVGGLFGGLFGGSGLFSGFGGGGSAASNYASAAASAAPGAYGPGFASGGMVGRDGERTFIPFAALAGARHFATGGGIPAILHPGEIVLNAAQQGNVADRMGGGATVHYSPTINGSDLTKEQLLAVLNEHGRQIVNKVQRNFGPMQADWQRRHG